MSGALRRVSANLLNVTKTTAIQRANVISGPPKNRVPMPQKVAMGLTMITITISPMIWVLLNVNNYRKHGADASYQ